MNTTTADKPESGAIRAADPPPVAASGQAPRDPAKHASWLRRLGAVGFLFFLIKGLLWLAAPGLLLLWGQFGR